MKRHAYGNTETIDLWNAWSEVSGKDVAALMATWTTVMGYPYITVLNEVWAENEVVVTLEQTRFLSDGSSDESAAALWSIPLLFATAGCTSEEAVVMDQKVQTFSIPLSADHSNGSSKWLKINAGQKALLRVAHSTEMMNRLLHASNITAVAPVDRAALLLDAYALAKAGLAPLENVVQILKALGQGEGESSSVVWGAICGVLGGLTVLMEQLGGEAHAQFVAFGKKLVVKALAMVCSSFI